MPVQLQHEVWGKVGYAGISLGLSLVLGCCTEVVSHDFFTSPLGQAGTERHFRQHRLTVSVVLHRVMPKSVWLCLGSNQVGWLSATCDCGR